MAVRDGRNVCEWSVSIYDLTRRDGRMKTTHLCVPYTSRMTTLRGRNYRRRGGAARLALCETTGTTQTARRCCWVFVVRKSA
ncbi:hypothetical protein AHAS_Ahas03G0067200 [Arachis hypogaea]